jgi:hypothetical protein
MKLGALVRGVLAASLAAGAAGCFATLDAADPPDVGDDPRALPDGAHFQVGTCAVDEMRERVCGKLAGPVDAAADGPFWDCPADPRQLTSAGPTMLFYTDTKNLEFDRRMTLRYRNEVAEVCGGGGDDADKGQCCFSRCTPLPAGAESTRGVPQGYREAVRCVDAPEGGTRHHAPGFEECPNALVFGLGPTPFEADPFDGDATGRARVRAPDFFADVARCCYRTLEPAGDHERAGRAE